MLDECVFAERLSIEVSATVVSARSATFAAGVHLSARWAEVALDDAEFARASTVSVARTWRIDADLGPACALDDRHVELSSCRAWSACAAPMSRC